MDAHTDTPPTARVLLVEDDPRLATLVERGLSGQGWSCTACARGDDALEQLAPGHDCDLVVLDRMLPGLGGIDVVRRLRERGDDVPVLMLTARSGIDERVEGLDAGADDYLVKPFALRELYARVRALLRTHHGPRDQPAAGDQAQHPDEAPAQLDGFEVDAVSCRARWGDAHVQLRRQEALVLSILVRGGGRPVRREVLLDALWPDDDQVRDNQLDVAIRRVRRAIAPLGGPAVDTVRGIGYRLEVPA